jgi:hypothetical protein
MGKQHAGSLSTQLASMLAHSRSPVPRVRHRAGERGCRGCVGGREVHLPVLVPHAAGEVPARAKPRPPQHNLHFCSLSQGGRNPTPPHVLPCNVGITEELQELEQQECVTCWWWTRRPAARSCARTCPWARPGTPRSSATPACRTLHHRRVHALAVNALTKATITHRMPPVLHTAACPAHCINHEDPHQGHHEVKDMAPFLGLQQEQNRYLSAGPR